MKFLLWAAIAFAVIWIVRNKKPHPAAMPRKPERSTVSGNNVESMIRCIQCSVYIPASEAVHNPAGEAFCCEEHRRLHAGS